ncbi:hypothetical protein Gohar_019562 [Gossypium harknessii]|uniref:DUF7745 domain-containing protein n=1 Tax=Gossypium harknessii TaxID=34285 RepID=A0A7J9IAD1_9ROSI|nr:hypothetical protein [Gossypium harknessii]
MAVRIWSEKTQQEKDDILMEGYMPELWDFTLISVTQNNLQGLKEITFNGVTKPSSYSTINMVIYLICLMSKWTSIYSELLPSIGILPIAASLLGRKKVCVFALIIYGLVIFPKVLGHIDDAISDLFDRLDKRVTPVPNYSPLKEFVAIPRRDNISEEKWMAILQSLQDEDVEWRALWMIPKEILYRCRDFDWIPLLGIWKAVGYTLLLTLRQYRSRQIIPVTQGLAQCEFAYKGNNYKKKVREISNTWNQTYKMKRFALNSMTTSEYDWWWGKRINDNILASSQENTQPIEEHL